MKTPIKEKTLCVFRVWPNGDVLALFPALPATNDGLYCTSFEHVGQHGKADYSGCIERTRPAKPDQYKALAAELKSRGYDLKIVSRHQRARHKRR